MGVCVTHSSLVIGCQEAYSPNKDHLFACSTGCHTPTLDSSLPDRDHLYFEEGNDTSSDGGVETFLSSFLSSIFQGAFSFNDALNFDDLSHHSEEMNAIMIPYRRADVTILTPDVSGGGTTTGVCVEEGGREEEGVA